MSKSMPPMLGLLLLTALAEHAKKNDLPPYSGKGGPGKHPDTDDRPINRKPMSRKLECPDCGQEVLLVRSITNGSATIDVHFLSDDGEHMVAGLQFPSVVDRDNTFMKMTYEDTKRIFTELMTASLGGSMGFAEMLLDRGGRW